MRLQQIGAAVAQLGMRHLQLDAGAANDRKILAPVELKCFAGRKGQRHESATPGSLLQKFALLLPGTGKATSCFCVRLDSQVFNTAQRTASWPTALRPCAGRRRPW